MPALGSGQELEHGVAFRVEEPAGPCMISKEQWTEFYVLQYALLSLSGKVSSKHQSMLSLEAELFTWFPGKHEKYIYGWKRST